MLLSYTCWVCIINVSDNIVYWHGVVYHLIFQNDTADNESMVDADSLNSNPISAVSTSHLSPCSSRSVNGKRKTPNSSGSITCSPHVMSPLKKMLLHKARSMESLNIVNNTMNHAMNLLSPSMESYAIDVIPKEVQTEELLTQIKNYSSNATTTSNITYLSPEAVPREMRCFKRTSSRLNLQSPFSDSVSSSGISSCNSPISEYFVEQASASIKVNKGVQCELYTDCQDNKLTENNTKVKYGERFADNSSTTFDLNCRYCGITFDDDVIYSIHMGCHSHVDPFICNLCGKKCKNKYCFYTHIMRGDHRSTTT